MQKKCSMIYWILLPKAEEGCIKPYHCQVNSTCLELTYYIETLVQGLQFGIFVVYLGIYYLSAEFLQIQIPDFLVSRTARAHFAVKNEENTALLLSNTHFPNFFTIKFGIIYGIGCLYMIDNQVPLIIYFLFAIALLYLIWILQKYIRC